MDNNKKKPVKPLLVARQDFIDELTNLITHSELPAFVIHDVLKDAELELRTVVAKQYMAEKESYVCPAEQSNEVKKDEP
jgi:hypothetical protein